MKLFVLRLLLKFGLLRADILTQRIAVFPENPLKDPSRLLLVDDNGIEKWACFSCPGGCGQAINLSLNPDRRPRWRIHSDSWLRPTVTPSIHQKNACACHFWVKKGRIVWCKGGRPDRIDSNTRLQLSGERSVKRNEVKLRSPESSQ